MYLLKAGKEAVELIFSNRRLNAVNSDQHEEIHNLKAEAQANKDALIAPKEDYDKLQAEVAELKDKAT